MSDLERAIYATAYVDALRNIYDSVPMEQRVASAQREAEFIVSRYKKYADHSHE